jgi:hypothetical protein
MNWLAATLLIMALLLLGTRATLGAGFLLVTIIFILALATGRHPAQRES